MVIAWLDIQYFFMLALHVQAAIDNILALKVYGNLFNTAVILSWVDATVQFQYQCQQFQCYIIKKTIICR